MNIRNLSYLLSALLTACATTSAPKELVDARSAYTQSANGKAQNLNPAGLHEAKVALDKAEASFTDHPDSQTTKDLAYIALRSAQRVDVEASTTDWQAKRAASQKNAAQAQTQAAKEVQGELVQTKQQLETERTARVAAETRAKETLDHLVAANAAAVRQEARGTVITLSGGVLFASGKAELLPGAQSSLTEIAQALSADKQKKILVEGHTDSRGAPESNIALSKSRADTVAQFLISRGVEAARVTANGLGASRPVADNQTTEGRATNRRVEIVIQTVEGR